MRKDGLRHVVGTDHVYQTPTVTWPGGETYWEIVLPAWNNGQERLRLVIKRAWQDGHRETCFCCSCPDGPWDPFCRNHGFAGSRRCEKHNTADFDEFYTDPDTDQVDHSQPLETVQQYRARHV